MLMNRRTVDADTAATIGNRQSKRTPFREDRLIEAIGAGTTLQGAAHYAGITLRTLERWLKSDPQLAARLSDARARKACEYLRAIDKAATAGEWQAALALFKIMQRVDPALS